MNLQNNKLKNFTPLPNEIFSLHLSTGELATYAVLMRLEDPRTYECWPSYETIGKAIGKSKSSVKRYVAGLVEKGLITVEPTSVIMRNGLKKNGNLRYHIRPIREAVEWYTQHQLYLAEAAAEPAENIAEYVAQIAEVAAEAGAASRRTAAFAPMSHCVTSQGGTSVTGRWESGKAEHRAFGAMASFAFVVRFSAPGRNRSPNAACGLSPHPFSWRSNV